MSVNTITYSRCIPEYLIYLSSCLAHVETHFNVMLYKHQVFLVRLCHFESIVKVGQPVTMLMSLNQERVTNDLFIEKVLNLSEGHMLTDILLDLRPFD